MSAAIGATSDTRNVAAIPHDLEAEMWTPTAQERPVDGLAFYAFMTAPRLPMKRSRADGLNESTAMHYESHVSQLFEGLAEEDHANGVEPSPFQHVRPRRWRKLVGPVYRPWEREPIPWERAYRWCEKRGFETIENMRRSLMQLAYYKRLPEQDWPPFIAQKWDTARALNRARDEGRVTVRDRFLLVPDEPVRLLSSTPHVDALRRTKQWNDIQERRRAVFNDMKFQFAVFEGVHLLERPTERATLEWSMVDVENGIIRGWHQPKKDGKPREPVIPERHVFSEPPTFDANGQRVWNHPSFEWYREEALPLVLPRERIGKGHVFVTDDGGPYKIPKRGTSPVAGFVGEAIKRALHDPDAPAAHALRRAGAMLRYIAQWTLHDIAVLMDDDEDTVKTSYIDWPAIARAGFGPRTDDRKPPITLDVTGWRARTRSPEWRALVAEARETADATFARYAPSPSSMQPESAPAGI